MKALKRKTKKARTLTPDVEAQFDKYIRMTNELVPFKSALSWPSQAEMKKTLEEVNEAAERLKHALKK